MSVRIMAGVWETAPVRSGELLVLLALADHANDSGTCFPSVARLAERARLSLRQTQRVLRHLEQTGLINRQPHGGRRGTDLFTVRTPDILTSPQATPTTASGDIHDAQGSCQMSPGTVREPSKNPPIVPKGDVDTEDPELLFRVKALKRKRLTTWLDKGERKAWAEARAVVKDTNPEEWAILEAFYAASIDQQNDFRRRELRTLLNHWSGEISKAQKWHEEHVGRLSTAPAPAPPEWAATLMRLYPEGNPDIYRTWADVPDSLKAEILAAT